MITKKISLNTVGYIFTKILISFGFMFTKKINEFRLVKVCFLVYISNLLCLISQFDPNSDKMETRFTLVSVLSAISFRVPRQSLNTRVELYQSSQTVTENLELIKFHVTKGWG